MKDKYQLIKKRNNGSALAYGLVILFAVSIILVSILQFVVSQMKYSIRTTTKEQAFQIAEAGVYFYRWYLAHETSVLSAKQLNEFWSGGSALGVANAYEIEFPQGNPIGKYKIEVTAPETNSTIVTVKSTGWTYKEPNLKRIVQVRFRKPSWSEYAVVTDSDIRFGTGTTINGKIHSNGGIRFDGIAQNLITSLKETYDDPDHSGSPEFGVHTHKNTSGVVNESFRADEALPNNVPVRNDIFVAGRQFPVAEVSFTGFSEDNSYMKEQAQNPNGTNINNCNSTGCHFNSAGEGRRIILKNDGTFDICTVRALADSSSYSISSYRRNSGGGSCTTCSGNCLKNYTIPNGGIIFVENDVWVEGKINNKKVTIVASNNSEINPATNGKNIYIGRDNLTYTNYDGKDVVGLVAQKDISVIRDSLSNLTIDAALLAQNGRVGREFYPGYYKSSITINGAIATKLRYGFTYVGSNYNCGDGVLIGNGYCTRNLNFDNDLLYYPPPYFPTGDAYAIDLWEEL